MARREATCSCGQLRVTTAGDPWEVTMCQWQKRLDPTYNTYGVPGLGGYNYQQRTAVSNVFANVAALQTTGKIKKPLVTIQGTMDALLPINRNARGVSRAFCTA